MNPVNVPLTSDRDKLYFEAKCDIQKALKSFAELYPNEKTRLLQEITAEEYTKNFFNQMRPYY